MKRLTIPVTLLIATLCIGAGWAAAQAQPQSAPAPAPQPKGQPSQADIDKIIEQMRKDARTDVNTLIGANMQFSSDEAAAFWPIYKNFETQRKAIMDQRLAIAKDYAANYETMTDTKATELVQKMMDLEGKDAAAKRDLMAQVQKALPGKTAARFYQVYNRIQTLVDLSLQQGIPLVQ